LLHDIGKPKTRRIDERGNVSFHGHAEVGAAMFRKRVGDRLGFEGEQRERIHFLILHHLRAAQYEDAWTDAAVRRFYKQMGDGLRDLLDLSRADITTKRPEKRRRGVRQISSLARHIRELQEEDSKVAPLPKGLGTLIMNEFGVPPSKRLGDLIKQLEAAVDAGDVESEQAAEHYIAYLAAHRGEFGLD
jgi:poly(A) polymerase